MTSFSLILFRPRWSNTVQLAVGEDKIPLFAHRHILAKVPFFAVCLQAPMQEKATNTVFLPNERLDDIEKILDHAYTSPPHDDLHTWACLQKEVEGSKWHEDSLKNLSRKTIATIRLYATAKKFGMNKLCGEIIEDIHNTYYRFRFGFQVVNYAVDNLNKGDKLVKYVLARVAYDMATAGWDKYAGDPSDTFIRFMEDPEKSKMLLESTIRHVHTNVKRRKPSPQDIDASAEQDVEDTGGLLGLFD